MSPNRLNNSAIPERLKDDLLQQLRCLCLFAVQAVVTVFKRVNYRSNSLQKTRQEDTGGDERDAERARTL